MFVGAGRAVEITRLYTHEPASCSARPVKSREIRSIFEYCFFCYLFSRLNQIDRMIFGFCWSARLIPMKVYAVDSRVRVYLRLQRSSIRINK